VGWCANNQWGEEHKLEWLDLWCRQIEESYRLKGGPPGKTKLFKLKWVGHKIHRGGEKSGAWFDERESVEFEARKGGADGISK